MFQATRQMLTRQGEGDALPLAVFVFFSLILHGMLVALVLKGASAGKLKISIPDFVAVDIVEIEPVSATELIRDAASPRSAAPAPEWRPDKMEAALAKPVETSESQEKKSTVELDTEEFPYIYYLNIIRNKISSNWVPPRTHGSKTDIVKTRVHFVIQSGGQVTRVAVEEGSGVPFFDQSALRAVYSSDPLPPLPDEFTEEQLGVHFTFEFIP